MKGRVGFYFFLEFEEEYEYWPKRIETYAEVRRNILTKKYMKKENLCGDEGIHTPV